MAAPVVDPPTPYTALIPGGFFPGKMIRIQGIVPMHGQRFDINLQCGAGGELAGEDVAFHASVRLSENYVARNSFQSGCWQEELGDGAMPIYPGQNFEVLLLCETYEYKMAVNGQHFCSFPLRVPYTHVSHLMLEGDVKINLISWEGSGASAPPINGPGYGVAPPQYVPPSNAAYGQPAPGGDLPEMPISYSPIPANIYPNLPQHPPIPPDNIHSNNIVPIPIPIPTPGPPSPVISPVNLMSERERRKMMKRERRAERKHKKEIRRAEKKAYKMQKRALKKGGIPTNAIIAGGVTAGVGAVALTSVLKRSSSSSSSSSSDSD